MAAGMCVNGADKKHLGVYALGCVKQPSTASREWWKKYSARRQNDDLWVEVRCGARLRVA
jgi:hypothetical protein